MKKRIFPIVLSILVLLLIWMRFLVVETFPRTSTFMDALRSDIISGWSSFYRGNEHFRASNSTGSLEDAISEVRNAISDYERSTKLFSTNEGDSNLKAARERLEMLEKMQQEQRKEDAKNDTREKSDNPSDSSESGTGKTHENSGSGGMSGTGSAGTGAISNSGSTETDESLGTPSQKDGKRGFTNTGTLQPVTGFWSDSSSGAALQELESRLQNLKDLQKQKGNLTRPNGSVVPEDAVGADPFFQQFF